MSLHAPVSAYAAPSYTSTNLMRTLTSSSVLDGDDAAERVTAYQRGLAAKDTLDRSDLTPEAQRAARMEVRRGEQAAEQLVSSMIRLSLRIVREIAEARYGREGAADMIDEL